MARSTDSTDFLEWIKYAEDDWRTAEFILTFSLRNAVWHFQQAIEKYFKAILVKNELKPPRTHDIVELLSLSAPDLAENTPEFTAARLITVGFLRTRYPNDFAPLTSQRVEKVREAAKILRDFARSHLNLKEKNDE